jgi:hypothetical protein
LISVKEPEEEETQNGEWTGIVYLFMERMVVMRGLWIIAAAAFVASPALVVADEPTATPSPTPAVTPSPSAATPALKVVPYGNIFFSGYHNTGATNNADIPLWAVAGPGSSGGTVRGSRFGLKASGAKVGTANLSGQIEADFFGGFPSVGIGDNMGLVRLRLALARLEWEHTALVVGQDWSVFAPPNPVSLACTGIPMDAAAGNPWARLPQIRVEGRWAHVLAQGAVLAPSTGDSNSSFLVQPSSGGLGQLPFGEARLAFKGWGDKKAGVVGVSGQAGRSRVIQTAGHVDIGANAVAVDLNAPIGGHVTLAGEAFTGKNLAGFQAGIFQGINPDFGVPPATGTATGTPIGIHTKGGWAQLGVTLPGFEKGTFYVTAGVDDPDDSDLVSVTKRDWRLENKSLAGSFVYMVSPQLSFGGEVRHMQTQLLQTGKQENTHINLAMSLAF